MTKLPTEGKGIKQQTNKFFKKLKEYKDIFIRLASK